MTALQKATQLHHVTITKFNTLVISHGDTTVVYKRSIENGRDQAGMIENEKNNNMMKQTGLLSYQYHLPSSSALGKMC